MLQIIRPAVIVIIPEIIQTSIPKPGAPWVVEYIDWGLKNTPEPITKPTTVERAAEKPKVFLIHYP